MVTFLSVFVAFFAYNIVAKQILIVWVVGIRPVKIGILINFFVVWQLAIMISALEDLYGFRVMVKSRALISGYLQMAMVILLKLNFSLFVIQMAFERLVVHEASLGMAYAILCFLLLLKLFLFRLSYRHENIDKATLFDHLEVYMGEYGKIFI
ncbi:hypothetical protein PVL29_024170 [Vitis rotundifolia]|uniref:Uncharacterized protein n=1 Tax=Vitis rotundifolia TaxID=103349 RepID=A0AA39D9G5_VITRO|nr:hypothetical protein PVL29_024170 [Vitis rotundifolia]